MHHMIGTMKIKLHYPVPNFVHTAVSLLMNMLVGTAQYQNSRVDKGILVTIAVMSRR